MSYWALSTSRAGILEYRIHHGPRDDLDNLPLYILAAAKDDLGPSQLRKRRLRYYSLAWLKAGDCWYRDETRQRKVRIKVGQVIAVGPGVVHAYGGHGKPFREDWVIFFGPVADRFHAMGLFDPARPLISLCEPERIGEIAEMVKDGSLEAQLNAGLLLQRILIDARFDAARKAPAHYPTIHELLKRIAARPEIQLSNERMAASCGMSDSHFRKRFKQEVGMSPSQYCERIRMKQACMRLSQTDLRIHQIAAELGYDDPLYFSKRFSTVIGHSPRSYRQSAARQDS